MAKNSGVADGILQKKFTKFSLGTKRTGGDGESGRITGGNGTEEVVGGFEDNQQMLRGNSFS